MAKQRVLKKNHKQEGDQMVITETVEKILSKDDLLREKQGYQQRKSHIIQEMKKFKQQYQQCDAAEKEVDKILVDFKDNLPEI